MTKKQPAKRSSKKTSAQLVLQAAEDGIAAVEALNARITVLEGIVTQLAEWVRAETAKRSSDEPEVPATGAGV